MYTLQRLADCIEHVLGERLFHILRYLISGGSAAAVHITVLFLLVHYGKFHYLYASVIAYCFGIIVSFTLQKFWTFQDKPTHDIHIQFTRYILVVLVNLVLNIALMHLLVEQMDMWYVLAQIFTIAIIAITGYFGYRHFVFTKRDV